MTITGALYVFKTESVEWRDRAILTVTPGRERVSYESLLNVAAGQFGTGMIDTVVVCPEPDRSVRFVTDAAGRDHSHRLAYLDP